VSVSNDFAVLNSNLKRKISEQKAVISEQTYCSLIWRSHKAICASLIMSVTNKVTNLGRVDTP